MATTQETAALNLAHDAYNAVAALIGAASIEDQIAAVQTQLTAANATLAQARTNAQKLSLDLG